jgi:hypothetical protein
MYESLKQSTRIDENYDFIFLRDIGGGEELTADFSAMMKSLK